MAGKAGHIFPPRPESVESQRFLPVFIYLQPGN